MPGQAIITIGSKQWTVFLATTPEELTQGLGSLASIPPGTGMLFDMSALRDSLSEGREQNITVPMLFPIDIVFLNGSLVVNGVARNVAPGYLVATEAPARFFLEVNVGEAIGIEKGQQAVLQVLPTAAASPAESLINSVLALVPFAMFMGAMTGLVKKMLPGGRRLKLYGPRGERLLQTLELQPGVAIMPRLPAEARGDFLFYEYIRDLVRMGESISDEEARLMWEDWGRARKRQPGPLFREKQPYLPQTESILVPFSAAPGWVRKEWQAKHGGARPRVRVYRTTIAQIPPPTFEYAVRDIVAHKAGSTMRQYVPAYESLLAATPQQKALYFGGAVKLAPNEAIAVMDYWGGRYQNIDLYVHPETYEPPKLLAPTLTERQKKLLATIRAYIPAHRKEVFQIHKVTEAELEELKKMGLVDQRGAITVLGRNVAGREEPWSSYLSAEESAKLVGPAERQKAPKELEFFADSADHCCNSMDRTGLRPQLDRVFQEAIARAKGGSR